MMSTLLEMAMALLPAVGLMALAWLIFGRWLIPLGGEGTNVLAVIEARGDGSGLEQNVQSLLWLRRCGLWKGNVVHT